MIHDDVTMKDKLAVLRNEQQLRKPTYHSIAGAAADDLAGGRYAQSSARQTVIGPFYRVYTYIPPTPTHTHPTIRKPGQMDKTVANKSNHRLIILDVSVYLA
jgi:hypothetical protein